MTAISGKTSKSKSGQKALTGTALAGSLAPVVAEAKRDAPPKAMAKPRKPRPPKPAPVAETHRSEHEHDHAADHGKAAETEAHETTDEPTAQDEQSPDLFEHTPSQEEEDDERPAGQDDMR